jgi:N-acetylglucosaminyl-diphospho-decaprenol L-rhamnosyltransferase
VTSIVIVNWNAGLLLERCVRSLLLHSGAHEIIVVDNASEDASLHFADSSAAIVTVIRNQENLGFSVANNIGWRRSTGEFVLFLNPDAECTDSAVSRLEDALRSDSMLWGVAGLLASPDGNPQTGFNVRAFPTVGCVATEMLMIDEVWSANPWSRRYRMLDQDLGSPVDVDQPAGACLMLRRSALESVGGFDEQFRPAWFEDVDLCKRLRLQGGRIRFEPAARFLHHGGSSLKRLRPEQFLKIFHENQIRYFAKHYGRGSARRVRALVIVGMYLRCLLSLLHPIAKNASRLASARIYWSAARHLARPQGVAT